MQDPHDIPTKFGRADVEVLIKRFIAFSFKHFIAELVSRPGFEDKMNSSWKDRGDDEVLSTEMHDVFDGEFLRNFQGQDGLQFG